MKKITLFALTTLLLASCSDENAPQNPADSEIIALTINEPVLRSRTSTAENSGTLTTTFVAGDKIGVSATGGASASNIEYTVATDGNKLESATPIAFQSNSEARLQAYTPYVPEATSTGVTFRINADQSTSENFNASNFMTSTATVTKSSPSASLTFTPRTALIYVEMAGELGAKAQKLTLCGMKDAINWIASDNTTTTEGDVTDVTMQKTGDTQIFMAFIPAQSSTANQPLFVIDIDGREYSYTPASSIEFKENTVKRFKLTVDAGQNVNIESSVIPGTDWTDDGESTEIGSGEITLRNEDLISSDTGIFTGKVLNQATGMQGAKEGWNAIIAGADNNSSVTISGDEAVISTNGGLWYQRALYFRTPNGKGTLRKYQLEFDIKGGTDIQIAVMRGQQTGVFTENAYFAVGGNTAAKVEKTDAEYTHKSLEVDLSRLSSGNADFSTGIGVIFFAKDNSEQTHYIKNVSLIEVE